MAQIAQALLRRASGFQSSGHGVALEDFNSIPATPDLGDEIIQGLQSDDPVDRRVSLFFCEGFLRSGRLNLLGERLVNALPLNLKRLIEDKDDLSRGAALPLLVLMRAQFPEYRSAMLKALLDSDAQVRMAALNAADTFLKTGEIEPLLSFERDLYLSETGGMGGPLHYVLRDDALAKIECMAGKQFAKHELTEIKESEVVFWWDWNPMLEWYRASKSSLWAKLRDKLNG